MSQVDLSALRLENEPPKLPPRPWGPRLLGAAALLLLLAVATTFAWPLLRPLRLVPMAPVRSAASLPAATTALAEAVGWVEADPFPTLVRPLVSGRLDSIPVLEGGAVKAGETVVATLTSAPLLAARDRARAALAERDAEVVLAVTAHGLAMARRAQNAEGRLAAAEARSALAERDAQLATARGAVEQAVAAARGAFAAQQAQERLDGAGGSSPVALERARAEALGAEARTNAARAELEALERERSEFAARLALAEELQRNPVDLEWAVRAAIGEVDRARAAQAAAAAEFAIAERELQWTEVKAPVDGIVLRLLAAPGAEVGPEGDGILALYDPRHLRARIDVPLGSVGAIEPGQQVELRSEVTGSAVVRGVVQRLQHESDLLKNTLQVKVQLLDPPPLLRPETLCRARFLGADRAVGAQAPAVFLVPKAAVRGDAVFVFDPRQQCARAVPVQVVQEQGEDVVVRGELSVTQRIVLAAVVDGEAVREEIR